MAERRMFAKTIVLSDAFLDMPLSARCLYFTLGMIADDDGFVNAPKSIMRQCGASNDDLKFLLVNRFIISFETGVIVIKHWRINNYLRADRHIATKYQEELSSLTEDGNGAYTELGIPSDNQVSTTCQAVGIPSIGKDRLDKVSIGEDSKENSTSSMSAISSEIACEATASRSDISEIITAWNKLSDLGIASVSRIKSGTNRYKMLSARIKQYSKDEIIEAINRIRYSDFLTGGSKSGWVITFDWFIRPNNFPKVKDGNYDRRQASDIETDNVFLKMLMEEQYEQS